MEKLRSRSKGLRRGAAGLVMAATALVLMAGPAMAATIGGFNPTPTAGTAKLQSTGNTILSVIEYGAIGAVVAGLLIGGGLMAYGHFSGGFQQGSIGRRMVLWSIAGALLVGAAVPLVTFGFNIGIGA